MCAFFFVQQFLFIHFLDFLNCITPIYTFACCFVHFLFYRQGHFSYFFFFFLHDNAHHLTMSEDSGAGMVGDAIPIPSTSFPPPKKPRRAAAWYRYTLCTSRRIIGVHMMQANVTKKPVCWFRPENTYLHCISAHLLLSSFHLMFHSLHSARHRI